MLKEQGDEPQPNKKYAVQWTPQTSHVGLAKGHIRPL